METLERSRVCRLCGENAAITIDLFAKRDNHVKKINLILPILVHEMDLLPKHMCHPCNYKLQGFYKFYEDCLKTDGNLKGQLSWMQGSDPREKINVPMVQINNVKIKTEPLEYDEQDTAKVILGNENITNFGENNYANYHEKLVKYTGIKCSRCGCYCGNRNWSNDDIAKSCSKTRSKRHQNVKKNEIDDKSRDQIRRNLFATEIFGDKNPRIQTEIPICNVSRRFLNDEATNQVNSGTESKSLSCRQIGGDLTPKLEMVDTSMKITPRTLRPRKKDGDCAINEAISSSTILTKKNNATKSKKIIRASNTDADGSARIDVKSENSEDLERSLRPRVEPINYSESKRKNVSSRVDESSGRVNKIKISFHDRIENEKVQKTSDKSSSVPSVKIMKSADAVSSSMLVVKLEHEELTLCTNSEPTDFHKIKRNTKTTKHKMANASEGKKWQKKFSNTSHLLRSQLRGYLRNGKLKKLNSFARELETFQGKHLSRHVSPDSKRKKISRNKDKRLSTSFRYQNCDTCKERFASQELYRLHGCYANKRH